MEVLRRLCSVAFIRTRRFGLMIVLVLPGSMFAVGSSAGGEDPESAVQAWIQAIEMADVNAVINTVDLDRLAEPLRKGLFSLRGDSFDKAVANNMRAHLRKHVAGLIRDDWMDRPRMPGAIQDCRYTQDQMLAEDEYLYALRCLRDGMPRDESLRVRRTSQGWKVLPESSQS